jgi:hypothetical protein
VRYITRGNQNHALTACATKGPSGVPTVLRHHITMSSNRAPPAFPVPNIYPPVDDLSNGFQNMHFPPPTSPPPGFPGGFNIPMSTLIQHDPYLAMNNPYQSRVDKPLPSLPTPLSANARPQPPMRRPNPPQLLGPPMPMPSHYLASSSAPSLLVGKPPRRNSLPQQSVSVPPTRE